MLYEDKSKKEMLEEFIVQQIKDSGAQGILLGTLGNRIHNNSKILRFVIMATLSLSNMYRVFIM